jgi:type IV pilus assembly protein PilN
MRLDINLASQPYEDARQFWMRWGTALGVLGLLTLVLLALVITGLIDSRRDRVAMSQKQALIADRERVYAEASRVLNLPENRATRDESRYLNTLIERKAFSWTRVLENLEKVMPPRVHLVSISPQLNENNELILKMTVAGDSLDRQIELTRRMEDSNRFLRPQIIRIAQQEQQNGDTDQAEMWAIYIPELPNETAPRPVSETPAAKSGAKPKTVTPKPAPVRKGVQR